MQVNQVVSEAARITVEWLRASGIERTLEQVEAKTDVYFPGDGGFAIAFVDRSELLKLESCGEVD